MDEPSPTLSSYPSLCSLHQRTIPARGAVGVPLSAYEPSCSTRFVALGGDGRFAICRPLFAEILGKRLGRGLKSDVKAGK